MQNPKDEMYEVVPISTVSSTDWLTRALSDDSTSAMSASVATQEQCSSSTGDGNGVCGGKKASDDFIKRAKADRSS
jgi:hypothetical protein